MYNLDQDKGEKRKTQRACSEQTLNVMHLCYRLINPLISEHCVEGRDKRWT